MDFCSNKQKNNKNLNASILWETTLVKLETGCVGKEEVIFVRPVELPDNQVETVSLKESEAVRLGWGLRKEKINNVECEPYEGKISMTISQPWH